MGARVTPTAMLAGLLAVFALGLLPYADSFFQHHPDERYYTDAAIGMVRSGDFLTPRWPDGAPRLLKPGLTYWAAAGSYLLLGVSLPASRLPFILAGALVIAVTYAGTLAVTGRRDHALLAAAITFSEHQLAAASIRAIPDVLLCLFLLVSAFGFLALLTREERTPAACWAAYGGAGLAVATKGLLGAVLVAFAWAFAVCDRRRGARAAATRLVHAPSMLAGAVAAAGWFAVMSWLHGAALWRVFLADQLTSDARVLHGEPLHGIPVHIALLGVNLLPWALAPLELWITDPRSLAARVGEREVRATLFVALWSLLLAVIFGFSKWKEGRYLLPAGPLGAVVLAGLILRASPIAKERLLRHLLVLSLALLVALGVVLAAFRAEVTSLRSGAAILAVFVAAVAGIAVPARRAGWRSRAAGVALASFVAFPLTALGLRPVFGAGDGIRAAARELADVRADPAHPVLFVGSASVAARIRLATGGRVPITAGALPPDPAAWPDAMLLPAARATASDLREYRTREVVPNVQSVAPGRFLRAIATGQARALVESRTERYLVAVRRPRPASLDRRDGARPPSADRAGAPAPRRSARPSPIGGYS